MRRVNPQNLGFKGGIGEKLARAVGFEPTTNRLTADRSTTELRSILQKVVCSGDGQL